MKDRVAPKSANEVLSRLRDDHNWTHDPVDLTSTGGIQRNITALWSAVQALADYADGVATGMTDSEGRPIKAKEVKTPAPDAKPFVSHPVAQPATTSPGPSLG